MTVLPTGPACVKRPMGERLTLSIFNPVLKQKGDRKSPTPKRL